MKKVLYCSIGRMKFYNGISVSDQIKSDMGYIKENGFGHEIYNFKNINGYVYGYCETGGNIKLERLGASKNSEKIDNILIIFISSYKPSGLYIVGWYKDATVYRSVQKSNLSERLYEKEYMGYYFVANSDNAILLPEDIRLSLNKIPTRKKDAKGHSNLWYADKPVGINYTEEVLKFIEDYERDVRNDKQIKIKEVKINQENKNKVEDIAIKTIIEYYSKLNYIVNSVEDKNLGWDLEVENGKIKYKVEVKGLSSADISVNLSPNEYEKMKRYKNDNYKLAVVTNCLKTPLKYIFSYCKEKDSWMDYDGNKLEFKQIIGARCVLNPVIYK